MFWTIQVLVFALLYLLPCSAQEFGKDLVSSGATIMLLGVDIKSLPPALQLHDAERCITVWIKTAGIQPGELVVTSTYEDQGEIISRKTRIVVKDVADLPQYAPIEAIWLRAGGRLTSISVEKFIRSDQSVFSFK